MDIEKYYNQETNTLSIPHNFNGKFEDFPANVKKIIFGFNFAKFGSLIDNLPDGLKTLEFNNHSIFDQRVDKLPVNLQNIIFGRYFNQPVDNLPSELKSIKFGSLFNKKVDKLPDGLESITFGHYFNQSVDNLPSKLKSIKFGDSFNMQVNNLPTGLEYIAFGKFFNEKVYNLPRNINEISFWSNCNIKNNIPNLVKNVEIFFDSDDTYNESINNLPYHVERIIINDINKLYLIEKKPFECKIFDLDNNEIII